MLQLLDAATQSRHLEASHSADRLCCARPSGGGFLVRRALAYFPARLLRLKRQQRHVPLSVVAPTPLQATLSASVALRLLV
jgi:hypothetical protein